MIQDQELRDLDEELRDLLDKIPHAEQMNGFIPKLLTACLTLTRRLSILDERERLHDAVNDHDIRSLRADLAALQELTHR